MFEFFIDAQPQKGHIASKRLHKFTIYIMNLLEKDHKIPKTDRTIKTIGMIIKAKKY